VWLTDFEEACWQSRVLNRPLLARSTLAGCPYCAAFEETVAAPMVAQRLERLVLFRFDLQGDVKTARILAVTAAPVALMMAPSGVVVGRNVGYLKPAEFLDWLSQAEDKAVLLRPSELARRTPAELAELLGGADAALREAAVETLGTEQDAAAAVVVEALAQGKLAARLGALEVLRSWGAPLEGLDPWKPGTVMPAVDRLRQWAAQAQAGQELRTPSPEEAERDLQTWTTADEGPEALAAYQRLGRAGGDLLPKVRSLISPAWDRRDERLTALRYRLLLPPEFARRFPEVPFQMAARDPKVRITALTALGDEANASLEGFFMEAFTDADGKVREAALGGLTRTGAELAREHVLRLLGDPTLDVRATMLKQLVQSPLPGIAKELAEYAFQEQDDDLVVRATEALREIRDRQAAFDALVALTKHRSWRVRAAAVEAMGEVSTSGRQPAKIARANYPAVATALEQALRDEDLFVLAKAIEVLDGLNGVDVKGCLDELSAVARDHRELTLRALEVMASTPSMRASAAPIIRELCRHQDAEVRAQAVRALVSATDYAGSEEVLTALADADAACRSAAALAVWEWARKADVLGGVKRPQMSGEPKGRLVAALRKLASAEQEEERFRALLALTALGEADFAFAGITEGLAQKPERAAEVAEAMPFLKWQQRKDLFLALREQVAVGQTWLRLFTATFEKAPVEEEDFLWEVVNADPHVLASPQATIEMVLRFYGVEGGLWGTAEPDSKAARLRLAGRARQQMESQNPPRAVMGLLLLCRAEQAQGRQEAERLANAPAAEASAQMQRGAREVLLAMARPEQAELALRTLSSADEQDRLAAFDALRRMYTPFRTNAVVHVGEETVWAQFLSGSDYGTYVWNPSEPRTAWEPPKLPEGLTAQVVRPFVDSPETDRSVSAVYLLSLLGDPTGLPRLVEVWRQDKADPRFWTALACAVSAASDDANVGVLRDIYASFDAGERRYSGPQLYRIIRRMPGPHAKELRKEMRTQLGETLFW
jgi:HEAT repeat protein